MDPVAICDEHGNVTQRFQYSPFGQVSFMDQDFSPGSNTDAWNWLFHGEFRDAATGYYNYGYRYYNDSTGRWPSRDPIGERGGANLYGFVGNNGVNWVDYLGLTPPSIEEKNAGSKAFRDLAEKLKSIAKECCVCPMAESDAITVANNIKATWEAYYGRGNNKNANDACGGYSLGSVVSE